MLFYALLCGFCHTSVDLFEDEENSDIIQCLKRIEYLALKELGNLKYQIDKPSLVKIMLSIESFHDTNIEGKSYIAAFAFYQAIIDDLVLSKYVMSENRIKRLEELHGLLDTLSGYIQTIFETEINYTEEDYNRDMEHAINICNAFYKMFGGK